MDVHDTRYIVVAQMDTLVVCDETFDCVQALSFRWVLVNLLEHSLLGFHGGECGQLGLRPK